METDRIYLIEYQHYEDTAVCKAGSLADAEQWAQEVNPGNPVKHVRLATDADFEAFL